MKNKPSLLSMLEKPDDDRSFHSDQLARVLKIQEAYLCGMCGQAYSTVRGAWKCVHEDLQKFDSFPLSAVSFHHECYFHCFLCGRSYVNVQDTALCLMHDLSRNQLPPLIQEHLHAIAVETLKGPKSTKREGLSPRRQLRTNANKFFAVINKNEEKKKKKIKKIHPKPAQPTATATPPPPPPAPPEELSMPKIAEPNPAAESQDEGGFENFHIEDTP